MSGPHAYEIEVKRRDPRMGGAFNPQQFHTTEEVCYVAKSEKAAIRKALLRPFAFEAKIIRTYTREEYYKAYGTPHRGGKEWG